MKNTWSLLALDVLIPKTYTSLILLDTQFIFLTFASMLTNVYQCVARDSRNSRGGSLQVQRQNTCRI